MRGFVDLQVNGYLGVDFSSPDLQEEHLEPVCDALRDVGTAAFLPTLISCSPEVYRRNLPLLAELCRRRPAQVLGIHLEGPFLSPHAGARGAHDPRFIHPPNLDYLDRLVEWGKGSVRLLTMAGGLPKDAELALHARQLGLRVALGHHLADADDLRRMVAAGAQALTHLGNGIPAQLPRHPNPLWDGISEDALVAMVITDGHHIPPSFLKVVLRTKGVSGVIVTSDAAPIAGLPPGHYNTLGHQVILEPSGRLYSPEGGHLVGSSASMWVCMNHLAKTTSLSEIELGHIGVTQPLALLGLSMPIQVPPFDPISRSFRLPD